jgi:hypothetical protein
MLDIEKLRSRQEQRRACSLEAWNLAKKNVEDAIALAETREREFNHVSEDVRRVIEALELVISMATEPEPGAEIPTAQHFDAADRQPMRGEGVKAEDGPESVSETESVASSLDRLSDLLSKPAPPVLVKSSSRPFFMGQKRSESLSILQ